MMALLLIGLSVAWLLLPFATPILCRWPREGHKLIRPTPKPYRPHIGDCTDEMFEAMREVDAITPSVPPMLTARLPPRPGEPARSKLAGLVCVSSVCDMWRDPVTGTVATRAKWESFDIPREWRNFDYAMAERRGDRTP